MTKQEAIKILKALWVSKYPEYSDDEIREALDMAIEALGNQDGKPCENCQEFDCYGCKYKDGEQE